MARPKKTKNGPNVGNFPNKYAKHLSVEDVDNINAMGAEELEKKVIEAENSIAEQEKLREADETLTAAKSVIKDLGGAYKESMGRQTAIIKYALLCLESKGVPVTK